MNGRRSRALRPQAEPTSDDGFRWCGPDFCDGRGTCTRCDATCATRNKHSHVPAPYTIADMMRRVPSIDTCDGNAWRGCTHDAQAACAECAQHFARDDT